MFCFDSFDVLRAIISPFHAALKTTVTISISGPFCSYKKTLRIPYPCGIKRCRKCFDGGCWNFPCGAIFCTKRTVVTIPTFCMKTFSYIVGDVLNGIQGVMDFIFAPLNLAVDEILNAIPLPNNSYPGIPINVEDLEPILSVNLNFCPLEPTENFLVTVVFSGGSFLFSRTCI